MVARGFSPGSPDRSPYRQMAGRQPQPENWLILAPCNSTRRTLYCACGSWLDPRESLETVSCSPEPVSTALAGLPLSSTRLFLYSQEELK